MPARIVLTLSAVLLLAGFAAQPARADGFINSLFNTGNSGGAKPLFLNRAPGTAGALSNAGGAAHTFGSGHSGGTARPSADSGAATAAANAAAIRADVARSSAAAAAKAEQRRALYKKLDAERIATTAAQLRANAAKQQAQTQAQIQAARASAISAAPPPNGAHSVPSAAQPAETPLYNTPGQTGDQTHAPIFGVH